MLLVQFSIYFITTKTKVAKDLYHKQQTPMSTDLVSSSIGRAPVSSAVDLGFGPGDHVIPKTYKNGATVLYPCLVLTIKKG